MSSLNNLRFGFNDIIDYLRTSFCIFARIKTKDYIMAEKHTLQPKQPRIETFIEVAVHVLAWSYIFISPLFFKSKRGDNRLESLHSWQFVAYHVVCQLLSELLYLCAALLA